MVLLFEKNKRKIFKENYSGYHLIFPWTTSTSCMLKGKTRKEEKKERERMVVEEVKGVLHTWNE